ncbi:partitioning defective 3 homolog isoform X3 [Ischnura elegans]|uniref:partitioning defective 3 homolog isoform X3 n=1 Tax=Ischnura elegans TaxID=197161 RepID=UPI001ED8AB0A|nr:partitioning defective 3 homolog isoform X3 [Ischnura elegans]
MPGPGVLSAMFEGCQPPVGPKCAEMAVEKISQIFGWRHRSYKVEKLQRSVVHAAEISVTSTIENKRMPSDAWVSVRSLRSQSGGGILDPDDLLSDVADDRETIVAAFREEGGGDGAEDGALDGGAGGEEGARPPAPHGGGDGASGSSSVGTGSPDLFHDGDHKYSLSGPRPAAQGPSTDIEVTGSELTAPPLQVRRGSEPTLNQLLLDEAPDPLDDVAVPTTHHSKRWSAAAPVGLGLDAASRSGDLAEALNLPDESKHSTSNRLSGNVFLSNEWHSRRTPLREGEEGTEGGKGSSQRAGVGGSQRSSAFTRFVRDSNRLSVQFLGDSPGGWKWAEAAERAASGSLPTPGMGVGRREPLGAPHHPSPTPSPKLPIVTGVAASDPEDELTSSDELEYVAMRNESGPLGIHVVPDYDRLGKDRGLLVQGIEPGGRIDRDGRLAIYDRIIEINGENLLDMPFHRVQEIFKNSLKAPELQLRVVKHKSTVGALKKPPPPVFPKSISREQLSSPTSSQTSSQQSLTHLQHQESRQSKGTPQKPAIRPKPRGETSAPEENCVGMVEAEERLVSADTKLATVSPTKKVPQAAPGARNTNSLLHANTRKIGKKIEIELLKGQHGLGFSITTRDNPAGGNCPIYIKNILPKGAAVEDGRLKPGDRLLEVNGVEMTGKSQSEAVAVLRNAPQGSKVLLVVSRQQAERASPTGAASSPASNEMDSSAESATSREEVKNASNRSTSPQLPRKLECPVPVGTSPDERKRHINEPPEKVNDDSLLFPWKQREIITFEIPVHDTEKAGLGVSVKGKTTCNESGRPVDLGIFVKSVIHGGAASRDGRLRTNDQLVDVNGVSLLGCSNSDAMETLRRVMMMSDGPKPGVITLTVARRVPTPGESGRDSVSSLLTNSSGTETFGAKSESESHTPDHSGASENSENTVIFLPCNNQGRNLTNGSSRDFTDSPTEDNLNMKSTYSAKVEDKNLGDLDPMNARNPVIDRLTGQSALRNESYYRATNDTWNATMMMNGVGPSEKIPGGSPTVNCPSGDMVLIEEEYVPSHHHHGQPQAKATRHQPTSQHGIYGTSQTGHEKERQELPMKRLGDQQHASGQNGSDITYESQTSLEEADAAGFSRDAFGRQSMSEKRHATLDAKNTDTYQRNKRLREERERQRQMQMQQQQMNEQKRAEKDGQRDRADGMHGYQRRDHYIPRDQGVGMVRANSAESIISLTRSHAEADGNDLRKHDLGPSLGMKKSSSLESLQTMVQEIQMQEDGETPYNYHTHGVGTISAGGSGSSRVVVRGRGCNESFRAAVDRSYEAPLGLAEFRSRMETLAEEDNDGGALGMNRVGSDRGGMAGGHRAEGGPGGPYLTRGGTRQSSLGAEGSSKKGGIGGKPSSKKAPSSSSSSGGLLKGIGSMFRFGKHRKAVEVPTQIVSGKEEREVEGGMLARSESVENAIDVEAPSTQATRGRDAPAGERVPDASREREREQARLEAQEEQQRIQEQYRRLMHRQRLEQQQQNNEMESGRLNGADQQEAFQQHQHHVHQQQHQGNQQGGGMVAERDEGSRTERIQQLRAQHQRRHAERRGQYPMDDREERYEEAIRQSLDHHGDGFGAHERLRSRLPQPQVMMHGGGGEPSYEGGHHHSRGGGSVVRVVDGSGRAVREVMMCEGGRGEEGGSRPGSRLGTPSDPAQFSHYVNYEEIQQHLSKRKEQLTEHQILQMRLQVQHQRLKVEDESRRQQHYHSQRRDNRDSPFHHARPVSNFYEYESVLQGGGSGLGPPHPPHPHHQVGTRRQQVADESVRQIGVAWQPPPPPTHRAMVEGGSGSLPKRLGSGGGVAGSVGRMGGGNYLHPRIYQPASSGSGSKSQGYSQRGSVQQHSMHPGPPPFPSPPNSMGHHSHSSSMGSGPTGGPQSHWRGPYITTTRIRPVEACGPPQPGSKV